RYLLRRRPSVSQLSLILLEFGTGLRNRLLCRRSSRTGGVDGGGSRLLTIDSLSVALLWNFILVRERLVSDNVVLCLNTVRVRLPQRRLRGVKRLLGGSDRCIAAVHVGLRARKLSRCIN